MMKKSDTMSRLKGIDLRDQDAEEDDVVAAEAVLGQRVASGGAERHRERREPQRLGDRVEEPLCVRLLLEEAHVVVHGKPVGSRL